MEEDVLESRIAVFVFLVMLGIMIVLAQSDHPRAIATLHGGMLAVGIVTAGYLTYRGLGRLLERSVGGRDGALPEGHDLGDCVRCTPLGRNGRVVGSGTGLGHSSSVTQPDER